MNTASQMAENPPFSLPSVKSVLRRIWPEHACKHLARAAGVPLGTAKDWLQGRSEPRGGDILKIALNDPAALTRFSKLLEEIAYAQKRLAETSGSRVLETGRELSLARRMAEQARRLDRPSARSDTARRAA